MTCYGSAAGTVGAGVAMGVAYAGYTAALTALNGAAEGVTGGAAAPVATAAQVEAQLAGLVVAIGLFLVAFGAYVECLVNSNDPKAKEMQRRMQALEAEQARLRHLEQTLFAH